MITTGKEKRDKIQSCLGQSFCPGVKKTAEGYEFTLEVPQGSNASLILYGQDENQNIEIPFSEESREGSLLSVRVKGIREEIKYNFQIDGQIIQDSRAR